MFSVSVGRLILINLTDETVLKTELCCQLNGEQNPMTFVMARSLLPVKNPSHESAGAVQTCSGFGSLTQKPALPAYWH